MSVSSHLTRLLKKHAKKKKTYEAAEYESNLNAGLVKGPLTLRHESGVVHPIKGCPQCTIEKIHLSLMVQAHERQARQRALEARVQAQFDTETG